MRRFQDPVEPFRSIQKWEGETPPGMIRDWLGGVTSGSFLGLDKQQARARDGWEKPAANEEWWEWYDILCAVQAAEKTFTMYELGAGYGRWCVNALGLIRQLGLDLVPRYLAVEAEPTHFDYLMQHFRNNGLDPTKHDLIQCAVAGEPGEVSFVIGHSEEWWGQAIVPETYDPAKQGFHEARNIKVEAVTLSSLIPDGLMIDIIDMDLQGAELGVVVESIDVLSRQVRRLHIGTHSKEIEEGLRELLPRHGWICHADFSCLQENDTPFGPVPFVDGVQSWTNPALD